MINIPVEIGDTILTGKFKNKVTVVKEIGSDDYGMPTINGKKVVTFRIKKNIGENKMDKKKKQKLDEGMVMISSLLPVGGLIGMPPKRKDNFVFKGLPGQFNKDGVKTLDEWGNKINEGFNLKMPKTKEEASEQAMDWQHEFSNKSMSWADVMEAANYFEKLAKKFGLTKEFKENGII
jgi:hypothetical protein